MLSWQVGRVKITRSEYRAVEAPLDAACDCATCTQFSRAYLYHLTKCSEPLAPRLLSMHNFHHYLNLIRDARKAIDRGEYASWSRAKLAEIDRHEHAERLA